MRPDFLYTIMKSLSAKLSLWLVLFVSILFAATFSLLFFNARQAVREESLGKAEDLLDKFEILVASKLHEKEVVARQTHWWVEQNLNDTTEIKSYFQQILVNEPEIIGIAAAFNHGTYSNHKESDFMIYYHRQNKTVVKSDSFAGDSYICQPWYRLPLKSGKNMWSEPHEDYRTNDEPIITFSIPLRKDGRVVGVYGIDVSLYWLSQSVNGVRLYPNMFGAMMTRSGAFVIHPDTALLRPRAMFRLMEMFPGNQFSYAAYQMLGGESGTSFFDNNGTHSLVAYKPFEDTQMELEVICPADQIMGHYNYLIPLLIVMLALLAIVAFCWEFIHRELNPLKELETSVKLLTNGHYDAPIKSSGRQDEVGSLTNSFIAMRQSIVNHLEHIDCNNKKLVQQNTQLIQAHQHIQQAEKVKTAFLQNMTDQMNEPVTEILRIVTQLRVEPSHLSREQMIEQADLVDKHTQTVTELLAKVVEISTKKQEGES